MTYTFACPAKLYIDQMTEMIAVRPQVMHREYAFHLILLNCLISSLRLINYYTKNVYKLFKFDIQMKM